MKKTSMWLNMALILLAVALIGFNQFALMNVSGFTSVKSKKDSVNLANVNLDELKSTGHSIAALFPVADIKDAQDAVDIMVPTGTPDYGQDLGVNFDDPVTGLNLLAKLEKSVQLSPEDQQRYINLASRPVGISCEFCCGVGSAGIDKSGRSLCGCQHAPALLGLTKWLIQNTEYNDAEILKEVLKWKTLFFPKDMVNLAVTVAGGDTSKLDNLPGM